MCIVVVDDEPTLLRLLGVVLQGEGYRILPFTHAVPVLDLKETDERPDLFLIDIMLPTVNGIELASRLADQGFETTPKIAMSAFPHILQLARESQLFQTTLEKPFDIDELLAAVSRYSRGMAA